MLAAEPRPTPSRVPSVGIGVSGFFVMAAISFVGLAAFFYPFFTAEAPLNPEAQAHSRDAPLIFGMLAALARLTLSWSSFHRKA